MFPEHEFLEDSNILPQFCDDLFQSWSTELGISIVPDKEQPIHNYDKTASEEETRDFLDFSIFKTIDTSELDDFITDLKSEFKLEPESPYTQFPSSPSSLSYSESNDSDKQVTICSMQEISNSLIQNINTGTKHATLPSHLSTLHVSDTSQVEFVPLKKENVKHTKYILPKEESNKQTNVDIQPMDITQCIEEGKSQNTVTFQDCITIASTGNSQHVLYPMNFPTNKQNIQNSLNIDSVKSKVTVLPQNVKIIKSISNASPPSAESVTPIFLKNSGVLRNKIDVASKPNNMNYMQFQVVQDKTHSQPLIVKNEPVTYVDTLRNTEECNLRALKRQQRMIKNRESACLSRKKKKEYVTSLEREISELKEENTQLKSENRTLKKLVTSLKGRCTCIRDDKLGNLSENFKRNKKLKIALCGFFFLVVKISFWGNHLLADNASLTRTKIPLKDTYFITEDADLSINMPEIGYKSRTLLSWTVNENDNNIEDSFNRSIPALKCPMYINQSESDRLDSELRRWIDSEADRDNRSALKKVNLENKSLSRNGLLSRPSLEERPKKKSYLSRDRPIKTVQKMIDIPVADRYLNNQAVEVFSPTLSKHASLFEALGRREDTFYVVWFSGEHLLLPASQKNDTARPKMSLVLPAVSIDGTFSTSPNHITMMQIDCDVTNTQLLHLQQSIIPVHLRNNKSTTSQSNRRHSVEDTVDTFTTNMTKNFKPYFMKKNKLKTLT